jgi:CheY-like chemotaxis protein
MKSILFADDDPAIRDIINLLFEGEYKVTTYLDGQSIMNNDFDLPDLFLLDKQLPGVDGLDICRFLKNQDSTKHIPIILISASPDIKKLAKSAGADDVIEKPFPIRELRQMIATYTA